MTPAQFKLTSKNDYQLWFRSYNKLYRLGNCSNHLRIVAKSSTNNCCCWAIILNAERTTEKKRNFDIKTRVSNRTWTRTVNPNEPFHFGEPEPNLNQQNFTSVNLNQTWTLKIVLQWTQTEPEPLTKVRIYFSISGCRWRWCTYNKSSGDHQQDQQFLLFFVWMKRVTTVKF